MPRHDPRYYRKRVGRIVRSHRERSHQKQVDVAKAMGWSLSKLLRIEAGTYSVAGGELPELLHLLKVVDPDEVRAVTAAVEAGRAPSWFDAYREVLPDAVQNVFSMDTSAHRIRQVQTLLVPGLAQTPAYARDVLSHHYDGRLLDLAVEARTTRQKIMFGGERPEIELLVDWSVLGREVGGPAALADQLTRLLELGAQPGVTIRVIPRTAGWHWGIRSDFLLLDIKDEITATEETVLFLEKPGAEYFGAEEDARVATHVCYWDDLSARALTTDESAALITAGREALTSR